MNEFDLMFHKHVYIDWNNWYTVYRNGELVAEGRSMGAVVKCIHATYSDNFFDIFNYKYVGSEIDVKTIPTKFDDINKLVLKSV